MKLTIRRLTTIVENRFEEAAQPAAQPLRRLATIAIVPNPHAGLGYVADLSPMIEVSREIGARMAEAMTAAMGSRNEIQSYGKGGIVGIGGELEHANALLTTTFATPFRDRIPQSVAWISSFTKVGAPGTPIDIPMNAITDVYVRSHYSGMTVMLPDGPQADEIALIFCVATGGRLNARVGGMTYAESLVAARS